MRRYLFVGVALAAIAILVYISRAEIGDALALIKSANWALLLLILPIQLINYVAKAGYYHSFFRSFGHPVRFWKLMELSMAVSFVNQISPTAGVSGATLMTYQLRREVPAGRVSLVEYGRYVLTQLSYIFLLIVALGFVYFGASLDRVVIRIVLLLVGLGLLANIIFIVAMATKRQMNAFIYFWQRLIDKVSSWVKKSKLPLIGRERATTWLDEFHQGYDQVIKERKKLKFPFLYGLVANITEVAILFTVFSALGIEADPGKVIISYAIANVVGGISLIPGDVGVYEVAMVAAFSSLGIPVAAALSATVLYRILKKLITLSVGFVFYTRLISTMPASKVKEIKGAL